MNWFRKLWESAAVKSAAVGLLKALVTAALATFGVASLTGCSALQTPSSKTQSSTVYAFGLPAVVITHDNTQIADGSGADANTATAEGVQTNK